MDQGRWLLDGADEVSTEIDQGLWLFDGVDVVSTEKDQRRCQMELKR